MTTPVTARATRTTARTRTTMARAVTTATAAISNCCYTFPVRAASCVLQRGYTAGKERCKPFFGVEKENLNIPEEMET
jgi:hypothetical protein